VAFLRIVQCKANCLGCELLAPNDQALFEEAYSLKRKLGCTIETTVDGSVSLALPGTLE
jgi:hypothetical protein